MRKDGRIYEFTQAHSSKPWIGTDARETSLRKEIDRSIFTTSISINYSGIYIDRYGKFIRGIVGYNNIGVSNFIQIPSSRVDIQNIRVIETNHLGENTYIVAHLYDSRFRRIFPSEVQDHIQCLRLRYQLVLINLRP